jgi:hypothetical protein
VGEGTGVWRAGVGVGTGVGTGVGMGIGTGPGATTNAAGAPAFVVPVHWLEVYIQELQGHVPACVGRSWTLKRTQLPGPRRSAPDGAVTSTWVPSISACHDEPVEVARTPADWMTKLAGGSTLKQPAGGPATLVAVRVNS